MHKQKIHTDQAPSAIGPYTQAVRVGDLVYTAGQGGIDPATGKLVEGGVEAQAQQTMLNLAAVLGAAGGGFQDVVKTTIFLRYIKDFAAVNQVYASFFEEDFPARSTVAVSALPMAALVEIEMVALVSAPGPEDGEEPELAEQIPEAEPVEAPKAKKGKSKGKPKRKKGRQKTKKPKGKKAKNKK